MKQLISYYIGENFYEVLDFCSNFTIYDRYNLERVIELNRMCAFLVIVSSESDFKQKDNRIRVMGNLDEFSPKVIDGDVKNTENETSNLGVAILQIVCLKKYMLKKLSLRM